MMPLRCTGRYLTHGFFLPGLLFSGLTLYGSVLHALDLSEVVSLAHENDANFQIAHAEYIAAIEARPQSMSVLLPNIDLNIFASDTASETSNSSGGFTNGKSDFSSNGYNLSLTQTLFNKTLFDALDQSEAEVSRALAQFQAAKLRMILRAANAYFEVLAANDNLIFAQSEKQAIARQLEQSTERFNAGLIAITDVKESQAQYDIAIAQEIAAENKLANADEELQVLINTSYERLTPLKKSIPLAMPEPQNMALWQKNATANNLDLRAAYYAVVAATEAVSGSHAGHFPTLNLNLNHGAESSDGSSLGASFGGRDIEDTRLTLQLDIPIYSGGNTSSKHRQAIAGLDKAKAALGNQKRLTIQQTRNAFRGINAAIAQAHAFNKALESTQSATEATQAGFEVGTRTSVDVLFAQRENYRSERDYSRALYDYILNILELKKSSGTLSAADIKQINQWFDH